MIPAWKQAQLESGFRRRQAVEMPIPFRRGRPASRTFTGTPGAFGQEPDGRVFQSGD